MQRVAVIGAGAIAHEHLQSLRALQDVEASALCDLSPALAEATAEAFGVRRWFTSHTALLEGMRPDLVIVATPPHTHVPIAVDALRAGCHVLCEKPVTHDLSLLPGLFEEADRAERMVLEDHNYAFNGPVRRIVERLEDGSFGEVVHVSASIALDIRAAGGRYVDPNLPHPCTKLPGGAIADFLTHLSYLAWIFVGSHREVSTSWLRRDPDTVLPFDEMRGLIECERGTASLSFSSHAGPDRFEIEVEGTRMRARASLFEGRLVLERAGGGPRPLVPVANGVRAAASHWNAAWGGLRRKLSGRPLAYEGLHELVRRTLEAIRTGGPPPIGREQIRGTNELVHALVAGLAEERAA